MNLAIATPHRSVGVKLERDLAVWRHISDGNARPNVIPGSYEYVTRGRDQVKLSLDPGGKLAPGVLFAMS